MCIRDSASAPLQHWPWNTPASAADRKAARSRSRRIPNQAAQLPITFTSTPVKMPPMKRLTPRYPLAELLEIRRLFIVTGSAGFIDSPPTPSFANGILTLTANNNSNTHILSVDNIGRFLVSSRGFPDDPVFIFDYPASVIILDGAGGDDALIVDKSVTFPITVKGGAGRDNLSARTCLLYTSPSPRDS